MEETLINGLFWFSISLSTRRVAFTVDWSTEIEFPTAHDMTSLQSSVGATCDEIGPG